mmetsp:Transcript_30998/g.50152  ORF Transcript_30998/g.50152 Transcript_30998/m.50152 type:complete len:378 (+) Transcript_30998:66-1199(+)|eukprot:CAMPEP_0184656742 /NCGR_PEP_ID=MMETSP0308-20130426/16717_1 /TAXON_ID=38269 /ORGANISM="Gloeochaete witrockiana, Strain SAG 46.84" /LENGTH=377 /DNA_ID=CAMNT_0027093997 /DNA_START=48 /DNA_END=1181 /DNA_ORIENTATION=+
MGDWIESEKMSHPAKAEKYAALGDLQKRKLWHQLTAELEKFVSEPPEAGESYIDLYYKFIKDFENKLNPLKFVLIMTAIARSITLSEAAENLFVTLAEKVTSNKEAYIIARTELASLKLKAGNTEETKALLEDAQKIVSSVASVEPIVNSTFYRALAEYHKVVGTFAEFYKNALLYLSYTPIESIDEATKVQWAFSLGLAALMAEGIYNFGELLGHPIFSSLTGTKYEWLADILKVFNVGNIVGYNELTERYRQQLLLEPALVSHVQLLKEKITILCLMELIFRRPSDNRNIPFQVIADETRLPLNEVEILVMKAMSLKLIRGVIDEVDKLVRVTWVQSRVLDLDQVSHLKGRLEHWSNNVKNALVFVENETPELFV